MAFTDSCVCVIASYFSLCTLKTTSFSRYILNDMRLETSSVLVGMSIYAIMITMWSQVPGQACSRHNSPLPKWFRQVREVTSHSLWHGGFTSIITLRGVIRVLYVSELVTLDASWNNLWFLFSSLLYMINICEPPQGGLRWQLTVKELKNWNSRNLPLSSPPPSPLPCPLIPLFFFFFVFGLMCFCILWRWGGGDRSCRTSEVYLASPWGVRWSSASQGNCQRFLGRLGTLSNTLSHKHSHT